MRAQHVPTADEAAAKERELQRAVTRSALDMLRGQRLQADAQTHAALAALSEDEYVRKYIAGPLRDALQQCAALRPADPVAFVVRNAATAVVWLCSVKLVVI
jgi:hypothetical protein